MLVTAPLYALAICGYVMEITDKGEHYNTLHAYKLLQFAPHSLKQNWNLSALRLLPVVRPMYLVH